VEQSKEEEEEEVNKEMGKEAAKEEEEEEEGVAVTNNPLVYTILWQVVLVVIHAADRQHP